VGTTNTCTQNLIERIMPYHPLTDKLLMQNNRYHIVKDVEDYLSRYASHSGIRLIGFYNPSKYGFRNEDFYNGMHSRKVVPCKIIKDELC